MKVIVKPSRLDRAGGGSSSAGTAGQAIPRGGLVIQRESRIGRQAPTSESDAPSVKPAHSARPADESVDKAELLKLDLVARAAWDSYLSWRESRDTSAHVKLASACQALVDATRKEG